MSTRRWMDRLCIAAVILALLLTAVLMNGEAFGVQAASTAMGYETRLFDTSRVHTIHIVMDDWEGFIEGCEDEEYAVCSVVIDGENYDNVGLRAKGNTSLSNVSSMGSDRYSFKLEFDQYDNTKSYYGLDKLSLNNLIQDNTMMKDYLTYRMMGAFGVAAPLCSYVYITVNGEDWGLYLAVEAVEDAFLRRNYGTDHGELYKPDSLSMGGGRGNGRGFDMADFAQSGGDPVAAAENENPFTVFGASGGRGQKFTAGAEEGADPGGSRGGGSKPAAGGAAGGGMPDMGGMGSSDVKLQYSDDDPASYANIFGNAKTDITQADQTRLIAALKTLSEGTDIESAVAVEDVIRYFVVHNFVVNGDSYTGSMIHNYYLYEEDGRLSMIPWDYNLAFGTFQGGSASGAVNDPIDSPVSGGMEDRPMIAWIFADETYTALYHQYFRAFLETVDAAAMAAETAVLIAPYVERDPTKFCTTEEFMAGVCALQRFCLLRAESVSGQLDGTVPATDALQSASPDALVDTGDLNLSDMGNMSMGGGFGGRGDRETGTGGWQGGMQMPDGMQAPDGMQIPDGMQVSGGVQRPGFGDITAVPGQVPGGSAAGVPLGTVDSGGSGEAALLALSAVLLAAGLLLAWKYPRRRMCR